MVEKNKFREDFYYRIYVYPIIIPPLRERKTDILPIAYHFLQQFSRDIDKNITGFDESAVGRLASYEWPGNVRQLRNVVERAVILCDSDQITLNELPLFGDIGDIEQLLEHVPKTNQELKQIKKEIRQKAVSKVEENFIRSALARNDWNVTRAAKETGLQRPNLQNMMKKHGITLPRRTQSDWPPRFCRPIPDSIMVVSIEQLSE